jgi:hypothetical protein
VREDSRSIALGIASWDFCFDQEEALPRGSMSVLQEELNGFVEMAVEEKMKRGMDPHS